MKKLTPEASAYLQSVFQKDEVTIQGWYKTVQSAFPYVHCFATGFLVVAMGGLQSALEAGITAQKWAEMTASDNAHLVDEN